MSSDLHAPLAFGGPLTQAAMESPLAELDYAAGAMHKRGLRAKTLDAGTNAVPCMVGHRSHAYPENTLVQLRGHVASGIKVLETDIQWSQDGVPILLHDAASLARTTTLTGGPLAYSLPELRTTDAGSYYNSFYSNERIPSVHDLFNALGTSCTYILEIKDGITAGGSHVTAADVLGAIVADYNLEKNCVMASFNDLTGTTAWSSLGIPLLRYTGSPNADGSIGGTSAATMYANGYRYIGIDYGAANYAAAATAMAAAGLKIMAWTVNARYYRDQVLATAATTAILSDDPLYLKAGIGNIPVGVNIPFNRPTIPTGVAPYYRNGADKLDESPSGVGASQLAVGVGGARIGYPIADSIADHHILVCGLLAWGGSGIGKMSADMTYDQASGDATRWGGLACWSDDRGHVDSGVPTTSGYMGVLRENGDLELYRIPTSGAPVSIGSLALANLTVGNTYTMTLEVSSTQVIFTANGNNVTVADTTFRDMTYCGLIRSRAGVTFDAVKRTI
jgi:glycerophosphoryl diester phosphodiesterase